MSIATLLLLPVHAFTPSKHTFINRRTAALALPAALIASPAFAETGRSDFILLNPFDNEFLKLQQTRLQLDDLARQFSAAKYTANDDDRVMVFQLLCFSFKPTTKLMDKMIQKFGLSARA